MTSQNKQLHMPARTLHICFATCTPAQPVRCCSTAVTAGARSQHYFGITALLKRCCCKPLRSALRIAVALLLLPLLLLLWGLTPLSRTTPLCPPPSPSPLRSAISTSTPPLLKPVMTPSLTVPCSSRSLARSQGSDSCGGREGGGRRQGGMSGKQGERGRFLVTGRHE